MKIRKFKVEHWMNEFENDAVYNLGETCIDSLKVGELLDLAGIRREEFAEKIMDARLTYSHIYGSPKMLQGIADLYENILPEQVMQHRWLLYAVGGLLGAGCLLLAIRAFIKRI